MLNRYLNCLSLFVLGFGSNIVLLGQDFFGAGTSAETAARAGVYIPSSRNALDALSQNPAGLSFLTGRIVNLSVSGSIARGDFSNFSNRNSPMRTTAGISPYGAIGLPLGTRWTVAAGFLPDLTSTANWQFRDTPGVGGADYGAQREKSKILGLRSTAGLSYRVSSRVSIGAAVSAIYNSNTLQMPYVFQSHSNLKGLKTLLDLNTSGYGWNTNFGFLVRASRRWELGAAYRTKSSITSSGTATGNIGAQLAALGIPFRPDFAYRAQVKVELPQAVLLSATWRKSPVLRFGVQSTWTNWNKSFAVLPVSLTQGTNADINGFLQSNTIRDVIPLHWKDQFSFRGSVERQLGESFTILGGFRHQNNPVPSSTLSPLTAAILGNSLNAGAGWKWGGVHFDAAYQINLKASQSAGKSALLSGEFSNSRVRVGTQGLTLSTSFRL